MWYRLPGEDMRLRGRDVQCSRAWTIPRAKVGGGGGGGGLRRRAMRLDWFGRNSLRQYVQMLRWGDRFMQGEQLGDPPNSSVASSTAGD